MQDRYLTIKEAAKLLDVSPRTMHELMRRNDFPLPVYRPTRKIVRIRESELHKWMENFKEKPTDLSEIVEDVLKDFR